VRKSCPYIYFCGGHLYRLVCALGQQSMVTVVSPGCKHCYAERLAVHLQAMGHPSLSAGICGDPPVHVDQHPMEM